MTDVALPTLKAFSPTDEFCTSYCLVEKWHPLLRSAVAWTVSTRQIEEARRAIVEVVEKVVLTCLQDKARKSTRMEIPREAFSELRHRLMKHMPGLKLGEKAKLASQLLLQLEQFLQSHTRIRARGLELTLGATGLSALRHAG